MDMSDKAALMRPQGQTTPRKASGGIIDFVKTIFWAIVIAIGIRTVAFEPFNIPSGSMIPTLLVGDYLFVSKFSYGYSRFSLPTWLTWIDIFGGRILARPPERGDVAVFKLPRDNKTDYIKRIVGLPGDRIQVRGGILHINGQPVKRERIEDWADHEGMTVTRVPQFFETLPNGKRHRIIEAAGDRGPADDTEVYVVPAGHYFAMGDNRDALVGFIPAENLVGRAEFLFFSTDGSARLFEIWKWPTSIRYGRIFNGIE
jgi:signal peptidase I